MRTKVELIKRRIKYAILLTEAKMKLSHLEKIVFHLKSMISPIYREFYDAKADVEKYTRILDNLNRKKK